MPLDENGYPVIPHGIVEDADCDGCLVVEERGEYAYIKCNACASVVRIVPASRVDAVTVELSRQGAISDRCPHCRALNFFPGLSEIFTYICQECGASVTVKKTIQ